MGYGSGLSRYYAEVWGIDHSPAHTISYSDCGCNAGFVPGITLDPFCGGSGRAARMARKLGRRFIGIDLKSEYLKMSKECYLQGETEEVKQQMEIGVRQESLL
jgi:hypothetical protein